MVEFSCHRAGRAALVFLLAAMFTSSLDSQSVPFSLQRPADLGSGGPEPRPASLFDTARAPFAKQATPPLLGGRWQWPAGPVWNRRTPGDFLATTAPPGDGAAFGKESLWPTADRPWEFPDLGPDRDSAQEQSQGGTAHVSDNNGSPRHIYWVIPAFNVTYLKHVEPLTPREKFRQWARGAYDPAGLALSAAEAALEHSPEDGFCGYGHHWDAYAKCFGAAELDSNISGFFGDFLFPVIMHHDPRYFGLGPGSAGTVPRFLYAVSRVVVRRTDSGGTAPNYSAFSGTVIAAAASNLYYPRQYRGFDHSLSRVGWDLANTVLYNVAAEFWPDVKRKVHRK